MNDEREFARKLVVHLSASARELDSDIGERLRAARERALAAQRPPGRFAALRKGRLRLRFALSPLLRSSALAVVVLAAFVAADYWATWSRVQALQEVDTALLIDDLPIDAYLDPEFKAWLQRESRS